MIGAIIWTIFVWGTYLGWYQKNRIYRNALRAVRYGKQLQPLAERILKNAKKAEENIEYIKNTKIGDTNLRKPEKKQVEELKKLSDELNKDLSKFGKQVNNFSKICKADMIDVTKKNSETEKLIEDAKPILPEKEKENLEKDKQIITQSTTAAGAEAVGLDNIKKKIEEIKVEPLKEEKRDLENILNKQTVKNSNLVVIDENNWKKLERLKGTIDKIVPVYENIVSKSSPKSIGAITTAAIKGEDGEKALKDVRRVFHEFEKKAEEYRDLAVKSSKQLEDMVIRLENIDKEYVNKYEKLEKTQQIWKTLKDTIDDLDRIFEENNIKQIFEKGEINESFKKIEAINSTLSEKEKELDDLDITLSSIIKSEEENLKQMKNGVEDFQKNSDKIKSELLKISIEIPQDKFLDDENKLKNLQKEYEDKKGALSNSISLLIKSLRELLNKLYSSKDNAELFSKTLNNDIPAMRKGIINEVKNNIDSTSKKWDQLYLQIKDIWQDDFKMMMGGFNKIKNELDKKITVFSEKMYRLTEMVKKI